MTGLPDLSTILAVFLAGMAVVAGWFVQLWRGAKGREEEQRRRAEHEAGRRKAEQASRMAAERAKQEADTRTRQAEKRVADGKLDHFENQ